MALLLQRTESVRHSEIENARRAVFDEDRHPVWTSDLPHGHVERSWQRCLSTGQRPDDAVVFEAVSTVAALQAVEANRALFEAGHGVLDQLGRTLHETGYFAILTNARGVVIDAGGPIDPLDRRAQLITRIGVDLSERAIGTSAIGNALHEHDPVWLHQGEHFFSGMAHYSCAGAPIRGPDGRLAGMLDLTGVDQPERPELMHLAVHAARGIENAMVLALRGTLLLHLNWPGFAFHEASDGLIALAPDGRVLGANTLARAMVPRLEEAAAEPCHANDLFVLPFENLFDAGRRGSGRVIGLPLPSGLLLHAVPLEAGHALSGPIPPVTAALDSALPLRNLEIALIRKAVNDANGNVMQAAKMLGISRATVYRKLGLARQA